MIAKVAGNPAAALRRPIFKLHRLVMNPAIELTLNQAFDFLLHVAVVRPVFAAPGRTHWGFPSIDAHACGKMPN